MASFSLAKVPWQGQLGLFVAISLAGAGAFYYFYEMPRQAVIATQSVELSGIRGRISKGQATARQLPEFRAQVTDLEARLESLKPILPDERDAGDLLRRVQTLAVQSNLVIRSFRPQAISTKEMHAEWPISLTLEGNYHNLGLFLDRVSKFPRIINIGGLTLGQRAGDSAGSTMTINCTATTFVLVDQSAAPPAAKGKKAPAKKDAGEVVMRTTPILTVVLISSLAATALSAQQPVAPPPAAPAAAAAPALPSPPPNFQYSPDGRRDPFVSLVSRGADTVRGGNASARRPDGVPGLETNAIVVRGILQSRGAYLAMVAGPDGKVFTVRAGDKLFDGVIRTITAQAVVILQEVNDPLSLEKQREVRKFLRGGEEVK